MKDIIISFSKKEQKVSRNVFAKEMIGNFKGGPLRDRRLRRPKDKRAKKEELQDEDLDSLEEDIEME